MVSLLRKIRKKLIASGSKIQYVKYAVGEVFLVVVGILIALQIDTWHDESKERDAEAGFLKRLKEAAVWNITELENVADFSKNKANRINHYLYCVEQNIPDTSSHNLVAINTAVAWQLRNAAYNELVSTGSLKIITDLTLRTLLDEVQAYATFSSLQLEKWRKKSVAHEQYFVPYYRSTQSVENGMTYYETHLDEESMRNDPQILELLKYWSNAQMVFHHGLGKFQEDYKKILERIECLEQNNCL